MIAKLRHRAAARPLDLTRFWTWKRARNYSLCLLLVYLGAWLYFNPLAGMAPLNRLGEPMGGDYVAFYTAGRLVAAGEASDLYHSERTRQIQREVTLDLIPAVYDPFRNPPFFAAVFAPLAVLDYVPSYALWTLLSVVCVAAAAWMSLAACPGLRKRWRGLACVVFGFAPIYLSLIGGQNSGLALLLYALIFRALLKEREREAAVWSALGLYKPQLFLVFPLVFLASRRWQALSTYGVVGAILTALSIALVGWEGMAGWLSVVSSGDLEEGIVERFGYRMHGLKSLFDLLLPFAPLLAMALAVAVSLWLVLILVRAWSQPEAWTQDLPGRWALTSAIAVLINPHLFDYDLSVLVVAGLAVAPVLPQSRWWIAGFCALMFVRPTLPVGFGSLQPSAILLLALTIWLSHRLAIPLSLGGWRGRPGDTPRRAGEVASWHQAPS